MKDLVCTLCNIIHISKTDDDLFVLMEPGYCNRDISGRICMGKLQWKDSKPNATKR